MFFLRSSAENAPGDTMFVTPDGFSKAFSDTGTVESPAASPDGTAGVWLEASADDAELSTLWVLRDGEDEPTATPHGRPRPARVG